MDVLMIHDLRPEHFRLPLERFELSFDDGLFSHYYYYPLLSPHPSPLIFFIATSLVRPGAARPVFAGRYLDGQHTSVYSRRAFIDGDLQDFMTIEELQVLAGNPDVIIGAHSHFHDVTPTDVHPKKPRAASPWKRERFAHLPAPLQATLSIRSRLAFQGHTVQGGGLVRRSEAEWEDYVKRDTGLCLEWFARHLKTAPERYGFPFNEYSPRLIAILKTFGFKQFYAGSSVKHPEVIGRLDVEGLIQGYSAGGER